MILRWLVSNFLREAAEAKLQEFVAEAAGGRADQAAADQGAAPDGEAAPEPPPTCDVACLFALGVESGGLVDLLHEVGRRRYRSYVGHLGQLGDQRVLVAESGVGRQAATRATQELLARHQPRWIVSTGFAGGLVPQMRRGHCLMADSLEDTEGRHWNVGLKISAEQLPPNVHLGKLLTVDRLVHTPEHRRELAEKHQALACDMETAAVAEVCRQTHTRFLAVRIISDSVDDKLPVEVEKLMGQDHWASKLGAATAAIWNRPGTVKDLWRLREEALQASDRLARFLAGVVRQLD